MPPRPPDAGGGWEAAQRKNGRTKPTKPHAFCPQGCGKFTFLHQLEAANYRCWSCKAQIKRSLAPPRTREINHGQQGKGQPLDKGKGKGQQQDKGKWQRRQG